MPSSPVETEHVLAVYYFFLGISFHPENGDRTFHRNVGETIEDYTASRLRTQYNVEKQQKAAFRSYSILF
jgi:hypothetical protein